MTVEPVEDVVEDIVEVTSEEPIVIEPLKNDTFKEESEVTITEVSQPTNGTAIINEDNTVTYIPNTNNSEENTPDEVVTEEAATEEFVTEEVVTEEVVSVGEDSFTYTTSVTNPDNTVTEETGSVTITNKTPTTEEPVEMGGLKAFPSAFGGGSNATGGRGGKVIHVTNLNASGSGSFREALETPGPAYIVFDVSGVIDQPTGGMTLTGVSDKTILGQTAPRGGITITDGRFAFNSASNIIMRYIRSRPIKNKNGATNTDDDANTTGFLFYGSENIMLDHVSASFSHDKAINFYGNNGRITKNITVSSSLLADSNTMSTYGVNPGNDEGQLDDISFIFNLIGNASNRTPNFSYNGYGEILNNVIHGGSSRLSNTYYDLKLNHIGNYYKRWSGASFMANKFQSVSGSERPLIYSKENFYTGFLNGTSNEDNSILWENFSNTSKLGAAFFTNNMHTRTVPNPSPILTPQDAYNKVINDVGANRYIDDNGIAQTYIDDYDQSVINNVINNIRITPKNVSNWKLPNLPKNTRPSNYDTDKDGIADAWEIKNFGNLNKSYDDKYDTEGYTVLEAFAYQVDIR